MNNINYNVRRKGWIFKHPPPFNIYHTADHFKGFWSWWDNYIKPLTIKFIVEIWNMISSENKYETSYRITNNY